MSANLENLDVRLLRRCRKQMIRMINKTDKRDELLTRLGARAITYQHDRVQVSPTDKYSEIMAEVADLDAVIAQLNVELRRMRMDALDQIDRLEGAGIRYVLKLYYTEFRRGKNGRLHAWSAHEIIQHTGFSFGWVYRILRFDLTGQ